MTAELMKGSPLSKRIRGEVKERIAQLQEEYGRVPGLAIVRAGEDPASVWYANSLKKAATKVGINAQILALPESIPQEEFERELEALNRDPDIHGIILQEPYPDHIDADRIVSLLNPDKDVDGVHPLNAGYHFLGAPRFIPATPLGGLLLLEEYGVPIKGAEAVVVGRSNIVGKPMALLLLSRHATVTVCHSRTRDLGEVTRRADILCVAVGKPGIITGDMIKPGATVVDFGTNPVGDELKGDVDFESAVEVAGKITPVPGGTGPVTTAVLLRNVLNAFEKTLGLPLTGA
ncbi:MAG: bifunctional 5,10-methylenetetrahydrofolate dehydrogenase/5,10-methenyltetrahydrofolate cyclohydrolase [Chloroflexi bacterium]|nr:bifunctional 5,10-methylenetetrahydrofolate dehydrogenase/5,10-methenyltetrahydrofolate cyclohydrolase [Chloroflexota bacterium]